jgi:prophage tail gpP-like protein
MTGFVSASDGTTWQLPQLSAWRIVRTDGTSCDCYEVSFPCDETSAELLARAARFRAEDGGAVVFTGVVDECTVTLSDDGRIAQITGRGLAALLLDNQTRAASYTYAQLRDILCAYVTPFGIQSVKSDFSNGVSQFAVDTGDSCWTALTGFCLHAAGRRPRFLADGTLDLTAPSTKVSRTLGAGASVLSAEYRVCRYGVISELVTVDRSTGAQTVTQNAAFDGSYRRVTAATGTTTRASARTARQRIDESARDWHTLSVTLPGRFLAEPKERVRVNLPNLGVEGIFVVREVTSRVDSAGERCTLELGAE